MSQLSAGLLRVIHSSHVIMWHLFTLSLASSQTEEGLQTVKYSDRRPSRLPP